VYPNLSVIAVGPSGVGKDTIINKATEVIEEIGGVPKIAGRTIEYVKSELLKIGDPAACYTPVGELTAFLGGKDYQKSIVQELTDLLSTNPTCDVGTKGEGSRHIIRPTISMFAGTTESWLAKAMPDGALEGGFLPRFLIVCEGFATKCVAWIKHSNDLELRWRAARAKKDFVRTLGDLVGEFYGRAREISPTREAIEWYENWYANRFRCISGVVVPYANRTRTQVHRLAMLMAVSRGKTYMTETDYIFAGEVMLSVMQGINKTVAPILMRQQAREGRRP
jgi:hypothetical protein